MERGNPALRKEIHEMVGLPARKENHFFLVEKLQNNTG